MRSTGWPISRRSRGRGLPAQDSVNSVNFVGKVGFRMNKQVYTFGGGVTHEDARARDKVIAGGKGANLAEMAGIGLPVPPGFTITTEECVRYLASGADFSDALRGDVAQALTHIEQAVGKKFGDAADPLL